MGLGKISVQLLLKRDGSFLWRLIVAVRKQACSLLIFLALPMLKSFADRVLALVDLEGGVIIIKSYYSPTAIIEIFT